MKKAVWNSLPPRPEDVSRVYALIAKRPILHADALRISGLTKTRFLCSIDALLARGAIEEKPKGIFRLIQKQDG